MTEIIQTLFSDKNEMKLEINNEGNFGNSQVCGNYTTFLNN